MNEMSESLDIQPSCELRALACRDGHVRLVTRNLAFDADQQLGLDSDATHPAPL